MEYLLLIIGFVLIIKASDVLVDASTSIAIKFKVPKMLIALTIVAFGTCAPELAISFTSISTNNGSIALANVIGSCIINILFIIGLASVMNPIKVKVNVIKKELPLLLMITSVFALIVANGILNPYRHHKIYGFDGVLLILLFFVFIIYIVKIIKKDKKTNFKETPKYNLAFAIIYLILSILVITYSAEILVDNAVIIAEKIGISQKIITMVVIVIGTSLPELFLTISSAKKKEHEIAIGNIIGTNIFNICIVFGLPSLIYNGFSIIDFNVIDVVFVFIASLTLYIFSKSEKKLTKKEGFIMLFLFILYYTYLFVN